MVVRKFTAVILAVTVALLMVRTYSIIMSMGFA